MIERHASSKRIVKFLFGLCKESPVATWVMIIAMILAVISSAIIAPIFISQLLTSIANGSANINSSMWLLAGYAVALLINVIVFRIVIAAAYTSETKMQSVVAAKTLDHLTAKSLGYHSNRMSGGIVSDAGKLNGSIERFWDNFIFNVLPIITTIISSCIALSLIMWQYSITLAILSVAIIFIIIKAQMKIAPISKQVSEKSSAMTAYLADVIGNIAAVKAFAGEKTELQQFNNITNVWRKSAIQEMKSVLAITASFGVMMSVLSMSAFITAILATEYHIASIGAIYLVISYTLNVVQQLWSVSQATRTYLRIIGDASPMISTLDEPIEIQDPDSPIPFVITQGKIEFDNVSFAHDENDDALFKDFSLIISPGEQIGVVGKSGSGKTSLTRLLLRFSDIDSGQILIDSQDITKITQKDLRHSIAYVSQEPILFHRSLRNNIAYGRPGATDNEIFNAAKQANALEFIEALPKGFDTIVGERGVKLSGGQRQRIAIARAILKDAPILVLDEATSALDSESEKLIQDALTKLMKGRTSMVIAHRLSTIAKLDRIVVLDNGEIIEQGTHNELLAQNGAYAKLWSHQSGGFIEE